MGIKLNLPQRIVVRIKINNIRKVFSTVLYLQLVSVIIIIIIRVNIVTIRFFFCHLHTEAGIPSSRERQSLFGNIKRDLWTDRRTLSNSMDRPPWQKLDPLWALIHDMHPNNSSVFWNSWLEGISASLAWFLMASPPRSVNKVTTQPSLKSVESSIHRVPKHVLNSWGQRSWESRPRGGRKFINLHGVQVLQRAGAAMHGDRVLD